MMEASAGLASARGTSAERPRQGRRSRGVGWPLLRRRVLTHVVICAAPASFFLLRESADIAGWIFWGLLGLVGLRLVLLGRQDELLCVLVGVAPFANLLRRFAFYNVVAVLYTAAVVWYAFRSPRTARDTLARYRLAKPFLLFLAGYYVLSLSLTLQYDINLRVFDLASAVLIILVVGRRRDLLAASLMALVLSAAAIGAVMLPHILDGSVERLGRIFVGAHSLGNPVQLGTPLALGMIALLVDGGQWLKLERQKVIRVGAIAIVFGLLALTTSRAGWVVVAAGVLIGIGVSRRRGFQMLVFLGVCALILRLLLASPFAEPLRGGIERTFGTDRSMRNRTSGRSDQWVVAYRAMTRSAGRLLWGYGPGRGADVYAEESRQVSGVEYGVGEDVALHSLFMQVGVEAGLLGLIPALAWLAVVLWRDTRWAFRFRVALPLAAGLGFLLIAATVSAEDTVSGIFLGLALLGAQQMDRWTRWNGEISGSLRRSVRGWPA
jgi:O-antigen ligase